MMIIYLVTKISCRFSIAGVFSRVAQLMHIDFKDCSIIVLVNMCVLLELILQSTINLLIDCLID